MRQTMNDYQENYFENNDDYKLYKNMEDAVSVFADLSGENMEESKRRIEKESNADWIILNSGKVAVNKSVLH